MADNVKATHPEYDARLTHWTRCRDANEGDDAVKAAGTTYLPKPSGQDETAYEAYKLRALWYGATGRTIQGLGGAIFRKDTVIEFPDSLADQLDDVTMRGSDVHAFSKIVVNEMLKVGRCGVLVDMPATLNVEVPTDNRPFWVKYDAEQILNWREERIGGTMKLTLLVLAETFETFDENIFDSIVGQRYRVLQLIGNQVQVTVFEEVSRQNDSGAKETTFEVVEGPLFLQRRGKPLDRIPFVFFNTTNIISAVEKPPLLDLIDVNFSHYRNSADLEHGRHFCGLPTPWAAGFPATSELTIGSGVAWVTDNPQAKAEYLEFTGQGLQALEKALAEKEEKMAALGARMLEQPKKAGEAADTVRLRTSGQTSSLQSIADTASAGLTELLRIHAWWAGQDDTSEIRGQLNRDFMDADMPAETMKALLLMFQSNAISAETLYYNLQKGEVARPGIDFAQEQNDIQAGMPEPTAPDPNNPNPEPGAPTTPEQDMLAQARRMMAQRGASNGNT